MNRFAEKPDGDGDDRRGKQNPEREGRRERNHHQNCQNHGDDRGGAVHDAGTEDHADGVEVVGGAGHQFAGTITHVEFGLEDQEALQEIVANVEFDVAGDADERPARGEGEKALDRDA